MMEHCLTVFIKADAYLFKVKLPFIMLSDVIVSDLDRNRTALNDVKMMNTHKNTYFLRAWYKAKMADIREGY
jgi:hypothetical protein